MTYLHNTLRKKYLARLNLLCNYVSAQVIVLKGSRIDDVNAVIEHNQRLISQLQEVQRALIYFKNASPSSIDLPQGPGPDAG